MSQCSWMCGPDQCRWPGVFSASLNGGGPWRCYWHKDLGAHPEDQRAGAEIVAQSKQWDGESDSYFAARGVGQESEVEVPAQEKVA